VKVAFVKNAKLNLAIISLVESHPILKKRSKKAFSFSMVSAS
jgi:hypothetical protein